MLMKGHARQLMTIKVEVATPQTTLAEAARELGRLEISGLPVVNADGQVLGILTESDLLRALLEEKPVETPIGTIMTAPVVTVDEFTPADTVARLLRTHRVHHLPVVRKTVVPGLLALACLPVPPEVA